MKELIDLEFKKDNAYTKPTYFKFLKGNSIFSDGTIFIKVTQLKSDFKIQIIKIRNAGSNPRQDILKEIKTHHLESGIRIIERNYKDERVD